MQVLALLPGLIAAIVALRLGPARAFLNVYLPVLLLLPDYYRWIGPGLPDPTMSTAAILPIAALFALRYRSAWRLTTCDVLVVGFAALSAFTEYWAKNYSDAQNMMFDVIGSIILPYVLAKGLVEPLGLRVAFAKRIVGLLAVVVVLSAYEFRMAQPLWSVLLDRFFPGQNVWVTTFRYGLPRVAGPFGHAILCGLVFLVGHRIARWLDWSGSWPTRLPVLRLSAGRAGTYAMLGGLLIALTRGPQLGALAGGAVLLLARARNRRAIAAVLVAVLLVVGLPAVAAFQAWISVGRKGAQSASQETAAYRKELFEQYATIALEHPVLGWGRGQFRKVAGLESTDNHFLLLALNHGLPTLALFLGIMLWSGLRLGLFGMHRPRDDPSALLAFTLLGIYVGYLITLATVYHGTQTVQLFFLVTGWADGLLLARTPVGAGATAVAMRVAVSPFQFRRVLV